MAAGSNDKIVKVVDLDAPVSRVWTALTDHVEFGTWFRVALDQRFEAGKKSTGRMTFPGHENVTWAATIDRMETERLFSFRWCDDGSAEDRGNQAEILTEFHLDKTPEGTRLTITESGFAALPEHRRDELLQSCRNGWDMQVENLAAYLRFKNPQL